MIFWKSNDATMLTTLATIASEERLSFIFCTIRRAYVQKVPKIFFAEISGRYRLYGPEISSKYSSFRRLPVTLKAWL